MPISDKTIISTCGEHFVGAYLAGNDLIVALPRAGTPVSDLFVGHPDSGALMRVQVKTGKDSFKSPKKEGPYYCWDTRIARHEENLWYAYVWLNEWPKSEQTFPEVFFIPSEVVVERMKTLHPDPAKPPSRPFFWMYSDDLLQYKGKAGIEKLRERLKPSAAL